MRYTVDDTHTGMRFDAFLAGAENISRAAAVKWIEGGMALCNGAQANKNLLLRLGDVIETTPPTPVASEAKAENIPLNIVYEDGDLLVINKPKGMVVHPAPGAESGTLVNALLAYCGDTLSGINGVMRPGIVHRIDKDTSGLLVVAKNDTAHRALAAQLEDHSLYRLYHALVSGGMKEDEGKVDLPIGRHPKDRKKMAVIRDGSHTARQAVTHYTVQERFGGVTYLRLRLETGRTHQIRVHMAALGHPLLGDTTYGGGHTPFEKKHPSLLSGQALHAKELSFVHPRTKERMTFSCDLPPEFEKLLAILREAAEK